MSRMYRVVYFNGEYDDLDLEEQEADQYWRNEEVKKITPIFGNDRDYMYLL